VAESNTQGAGDRIEFPVDFGGTENIPAQLVNHINVIHDGILFQVYLAQVMLPPMVNRDELDRLARDGIKGNVMARIVLTPGGAISLYESLGEAIDEFQAAQERNRGTQTR
jgi:hypothetical protein